MIQKSYEEGPTVWDGLNSVFRYRSRCWRGLVCFWFCFSNAGHRNGYIGSEQDLVWVFSIVLEQMI